MSEKMTMSELLAKRNELYSSGTSGSVDIYQDPLLRVAIFRNSAWTFNQPERWENLDFWLDFYTPAGVKTTVDLTLEASVSQPQSAAVRWTGSHSWTGIVVEQHNTTIPKMHHIFNNLQVKSIIQQHFTSALEFRVTSLSITLSPEVPPRPSGSPTPVVELINS